ncbi:unnamed protein product [Macrosiphum euphorbiae]|uniref:HAT C-terminal dimerisation domain-containing protein n=1 Tax=Macrosiphum euphorbiae TaxID=13131 RepID=A0AAV0WL82_9HEMI|nr:unnamed protein product [Macrosiphum euphorbiae]
MFSIFKKRKPKADIDDPGMVDISTNSTTHTSDTTLDLADLGNKDSGPCRPILTEYKKGKGKINKEAFPNLYKLLQIAITIPISSATCERSFSSMRRIKNWLRTSMLQQRFSDLSILNIERDLSNKIQTETVLDRYNTKTRKIVLK